MAVLGMIAEICGYQHQLILHHSALPTIDGQIYTSIGHEAPTIMGVILIMVTIFLIYKKASRQTYL